MQQLGERSHAPIRDLVLAEVDVGDGKVIDQTGREHPQLVVVNTVAAQIQQNQRLAALEAASERAAVGQLHAK